MLGAGLSCLDDIGLRGNENHQFKNSLANHAAGNYDAGSNFVNRYALFPAVITCLNCMKSILCMNRLLALLIIFIGAGESMALGEDFRQSLISVEENTRVDTWFVDGNDLKLATDAAWSVRKRILHGGKQEGVDIVEVNNGKLSFVVVPSRGMSVYEVTMGDVRLGWDSPVKELVHPRHINLESRGGLGWLEGFNEWMVRCGLEYAGHPGEDKFISNTGDEASMDLTLHGKFGNLPASEVEVIIDQKPPHRIRIRGRVDERIFYGPKLEMWTEISTEPGSSSFMIEDELVNRGGEPQEFQLIYHANFGPPLLEAGSRLVAPVRHVAPMNAHAAKALDQFEVYGKPTAGFAEEVYCIRPWANAEGRTMIMLQNAAGDRGLTMGFSTNQLPYLTQWKNTAGLNDGYVTGLEPGTGFPYNRRVERHYGRVPKLQPGDSRRFQLEFQLLSNASDVSRGAKAVDAIQAGRETSRQNVPEADLTQFE
jgi:hypothetical protein